MTDPVELSLVAAVVVVPVVGWAVCCLVHEYYWGSASFQFPEALSTDRGVYQLYLENLCLALVGQKYCRHLDVLAEDFVLVAHGSMKVPKVLVYP